MLHSVISFKWNDNMCRKLETQSKRQLNESKFLSELHYL